MGKIIKQYVYCLEDQNSPGTYLTTNTNGTLESHSIDDIPGNAIDITADMELSSVIKLGIQAPPGTRFSLQEKKIMVGTSGLYELDQESLPQDKVILKFIPTENYVKKIEASQEQLEQAKEALNEAEAVRIRKMAGLDSDNYLGYIEANDEYLSAYNKAVAQYYYGDSGVYEVEGKKQLQNIIIDLIQEETEVSDQ